MLSLLNNFAHGYVFIPVVSACRKAGLFDLLSKEAWLGFDDLALELNANSGHFRVAMRMLESLQWLEVNDRDEYRLCKKSDSNKFAPEDIYKLMSFPFGDFIAGDTQEDLTNWLQLSFSDWYSDDKQMSVFLDGQIVVPLLLELKKSSLNASYDSNTKTLDVRSLNSQVAKNISRLFCEKAWAKEESGVLVLNATGQYLWEKAYNLGVVASYRPLLQQMEQLIFGDCRSIFMADENGNETHIERTLNVIGSGFQHQKYFADMESVILSIFDGEDFASQPRYVADMGCGDGSFLKSIYKLILTKTPRGKVLSEFPLTFIGIDINQKSLDQTAKNLQGMDYFGLMGDIGDPARLIEDLRHQHGIDDPENILHVRTFLDHDRPYIEPKQNATEQLMLTNVGDGVYVNSDGSELDRAFVFQSLVEHFERWGTVESKYGIIILEVHNLDPISVGRFLDSESFHFDATQAFSSQLLVTADVFLMSAARAGLFPRQDSGVNYPKTLPITRITVNFFEMRDYRVRFAQNSDLPALMNLEEHCWQEGIRASESMILERINHFPMGQMVLEIAGAIVGVIYSQRVSHPEKVIETPAATAHTLHDSNGAHIQLIALNIDPDKQHLNLGDQLLEFMLQRCTVMNGIESVVGVTRCKDYDRNNHISLEQYIQLRNSHGRLVDPILRFHELHGAQIQSLVEGYRPQDKSNLGYGVLLTYDIRNRRRDDFSNWKRNNKGLAEQLNEWSEDRIEHVVLSTVQTLLRSNVKDQFSLHTPLMDLGFDSADIMELTESLSQQFSEAFSATFFFQYNTCEKTIQYLKEKYCKTREENASFPSVNTAKTIKQPTRSDRSISGRNTTLPKQDCSEKDIAIIGVSCRLPGEINHPEALWQALIEGKDIVSSLPEDRWQWPVNIDPEDKHLGIDSGAFLEDISGFDSKFFRISPAEAILMDPQQRLLLEMSWDCLESAAYSPGHLSGSRTGVFVGASGSDYRLLLEQNHLETPAHVATGNSMAVLANRLSYFFNFLGPSLQIDTACSSSLVAVQSAVNSLRKGECDQALVGGINVMCHPSNTLAYYNAGMLSRDGRCQVFDERANGYVRAEGAVMLLLKSLEKAVADRDCIHGVIKGVASNHGGLANGLTVPNPNQQASLLKEAWKDAGVEPDSISYIEAHGTGTKLGDPIEVSGLRSAFGESDKNARCGLGSLKSNLGHLEAAAGIAGLLKVVLSLKNGELPPSINFEKLNSKIEIEDSPFYVVQEHQLWDESASVPRRAGVSSFGSGGSNAHVVLEEYRCQEPEETNATGYSAYLVVLSARSETQLRKRVQQLVAFSERDVCMPDVSYSLLCGREHLEYRLATVVDSRDEMIQRLKAWLDSSATPEIFTHRIKESLRRENAFLKRSGNQALESCHSASTTAEYRENLSAIAELFVRGYQLDYDQLFLHGDHKKISLPTYPFERERFWVGTDSSQSSFASGGTSIHPLVQENTSTLFEQRFSSTFTGEEFFLNDHRVKGKRVLPAAAYLEMARVAVEQAIDGLGENTSIVLENIVWSNQFTVDTSAKALHIALFSEREGSISYEIYTRNTDESQTFIHSQGGVTFANTAPESIDLVELKARMSGQRLDHEQCYQRFAEIGLDYGAAHRSLHEVYCGDDEVLADIKLPGAILPKQDDYHLHPSLLDAALQAGIALELDFASTAPKSNPKTRLPFALESLSIFGKCSGSLYAWIRYSEKAAGRVRKLDMDLYNESGQLLAKLVGYSTREFDVQTSSRLVASSEIIRTDVKADVEVSIEAYDVELPSLDLGTLKEKTVAYLKKQLSLTLQVPASQIDAEELLDIYGLDSIMVTKITAGLEETFGTLPKTLFYEYLTVEELSEYLLASHRARLEALFLRNGATPSESKPLPATTSQQPPQQNRATGHRFLPATQQLRSPATQPLNIAVVGLSGRYPQARDLEEYWQNLREGRDCVEEIPAERWDWRDYYGEDRNQPGFHYSKWGGFITEVDFFDPLFFNISPREATAMDPQERLFLEHAWLAVEDAGYRREDLGADASDPSRQVGVYAGVMYGDYQRFATTEVAREQGVVPNSLYASVANRVSYALDLKGPSIALDTMCSSSLTALHLACQDLKHRLTGLAIVGGVNVTIHPGKYLMLSAGQFISSRGHCDSFGAGGDGYVPAEGVGVAVLKRYEDAERDGDHIYGVIKGCAINHGGKTNGYTVPNPKAQKAAIISALTEAQISPEAVSYIEAHGTGTKLGDPIEVAALSQAFGSERKQYCLLGSAKSNIGHGESVAGIAGLTKVLLQMRHKQIVPSLHSKKLNPNIEFEDTPFEVNQTLKPWQRPNINGKETPRVAGISSFGAGGSNAHVIIEEYLEAETNQDLLTDKSKRVLLPLSARDPERLKVYAQKLLDFVKRDEHFAQTRLANIAYTMQVGREAMDSRLGLIVDSAADLIVKLQAYIEEREEEGLYVGQAKGNREMLSLFDSDNDIAIAIDSWIAKEKYDPLVRLWVKGLKLDWQRLYGEQRPRRMSLPTYPFAKEQYWVKGSLVKPVDPNTTLMFEPVWTEQAIPQTSAPLAYSEHHVFICGLGDTAPLFKSDAGAMSLHWLASERASSEEQFKDISLALLEGVQAILAQKPKGSVLVQVAVPAEGPARLLAGLVGLLKTTYRENPKVVVQLIALSTSQISAEIISLLQANSSCPQDGNVRYEGNRRLVEDFREIAQTHRINTDVWRENGVYLITGGLGGLGLIFAEEIANKAVNATLILTGRSELSYDKQAMLHKLEEKDVSAEYRAIDVSDHSAVDGLVRDIEAKYGRLDGVIHSAGINKDNFVVNKTTTEFEQVLLPKVDGITNLDHAVQAMSLDFFVVFSSISAVLGNVGQVDYATANAYMDVFCTCRQTAEGCPGKSLSINWPLWESGGMHVDEVTANIMREDMGMVALDTVSGLSAFYRALSNTASQVVVLKGDEEKLNTLMSANEILSLPVVRDEIPEGPVDREQLYAETLKKVSELLSETIDLPIAKIDKQEPLANYGIDSIAINRFNHELGKFYQDLPKTVLFEYRTLGELTEYLVDEHTVSSTILAGIKSYTQSAEPQNPLNEGPVAVVENPPTPDIQTPEVKPSVEPVAIVGMSGRFPKADNLQDFWENLKAARDCIGEIPEKRWLQDGFYEADRQVAIAEGKSYSKWGAFLEDFAEFDPMFFNISPREAKDMDPHERVFLQECWKACEDAGSVPSQLSEQQKNRVGVYGGITQNGVNASFASLVNRVSYVMDFRGPSVVVDTMCSSSLAALHRACDDLHRGDIDMAVAGAVNLYLTSESYRELSRAQLIADGPLPKVFDKDGIGFVPSEGVGVVVLKRLSDAERDGNTVLATIVGSAVNHNGKSNGYMVPDPSQQARVVTQAIANAGLEPDDISYLELAANGSETADAIEMSALKKVFKSSQGFTKKTLRVGTLKSSLGHGQGVSGMAQIMKVVLQLRNAQLCPALPSSRSDIQIDEKVFPFAVQTEHTQWPVSVVGGIEQPRRAGITSIGAGGVNAHLIVEEYKSTVSADAQEKVKKPVVFVLSAKSPAALERYLLVWKAFLATRPEIDLQQLSYSLQVGREAMQQRFACVVESIDELMQTIDGAIVKLLSLNSFMSSVGSEDMSSASSANVNRGEQFDQLTQLAESWVLGHKVQWNNLYPDLTLKTIIGLPTYPFQKKTFWSDAEVEQPPVINQVSDKENNAIVSQTVNEPQLEKLMVTKEIPVEESLDFPAKTNLKSSMSHKEIKENIRDIIQEVLCYDDEDNEELNDQMNFFEMGFCSRTIVEFSIQLNERFNVTFPQTVAFDFPQIPKLATFIESELQEDADNEENVNSRINEEHRDATTGSEKQKKDEKMKLESILSVIENGDMTTDEALELINQVELIK
ncbi:SDR family NAD(P)-dependent oxidoreductase [Motilimonas sp. 1_MG-2023]|uniref:SDR family NAD(P)-dependent oxidoreductase n=1 Tax=Motilimonas sp. 1_MG-2023 TaxID=3062672 RepID=UPI0026E4211E|nr:SDR family NAD(P)-dependent oxidoreductase [Motilimonas sp. 1_MG-2023]MDO6526354.1 SDR family NAD(P)-dependent oxidoreductase [Motilimonas sp. 1_MG-2023]